LQIEKPIYIFTPGFTPQLHFPLIRWNTSPWKENQFVLRFLRYNSSSEWLNVFSLWFKNYPFVDIFQQRSKDFFKHTALLIIIQSLSSFYNRIQFHYPIESASIPPLIYHFWNNGIKFYWNNKWIIKHPIKFLKPDCITLQNRKSWKTFIELIQSKSMVKLFIL